jgi:serine/threonine protein kinase
MDRLSGIGSNNEPSPLSITQTVEQVEELAKRVEAFQKSIKDNPDTPLEERDQQEIQGILEKIGELSKIEVFRPITPMQGLFDRVLQTRRDAEDACQSAALFVDEFRRTTSFPELEGKESAPIFYSYRILILGESVRQDSLYLQSIQQFEQRNPEDVRLEAFKKVYKKDPHFSFSLQTNMGVGYFRGMGSVVDPRTGRQQLLGVGLTARVFTGEVNGEKLAVKVIDSSLIEQADLDREIQFLEEVQSCPYAIGALEVGCLDNFIFIVMPKAEGKELFDKVRTSFTLVDSSQIGNNNFSLSQRVTALLDIASGLDWIHSRGIIHRDIKLENVIVNQSGNAKIIDFGFSRRISDNEIKKQGTPFYAPPEVYKGHVQGSACDIYSFGVLMDLVLSNEDYITRDPKKHGEVNVKLRYEDVPVDEYRYSNLLDFAWEQLVAPACTEYLEVASTQNRDIKREKIQILQKLKEVFLNPLEDFNGVLEKLKMKSSIYEEVKDKIEKLGDDSLWSKTVEFRASMIDFQKKAASIVASCLKCNPLDRIETPILFQELQELNNILF